MKHLPPQNEERYDILLARVRQAHRAMVAETEPSDARWAALVESVRSEPKTKNVTERSWFRPALALCVITGALGGLFLYDAGLERGVVSHVAEAPPTGRAGLWQATQGPETLTFTGGHTAQLAAGAVLEVARASRDLFDARVTRGSVAFQVAPRAAGELFRVRLGPDYLEVRGTAFTVTVTSDAADPLRGVAVAHGTVAVFSGGRTHILRGGERWVAPATEGVVDAPRDQGENSRINTTADQGEADPAAKPSDQAEAGPAEAPRNQAEAGLGVAREAQPELVVEGAPVDSDPAIAPSLPERTLKPAGQDNAHEAESAPPRSEVSSASKPQEASTRAPHARKTAVVVVPPQRSPLVAVEPMSAGVERALLASMRAGDCVKVERALAGVIQTQGAAASGEAWWLRAWCARHRGDEAASLRYFENARGKVRWAIPAPATLPAIPTR